MAATDLTLLSVSPSSGKSALVSALSILLERRGRRVQPFKAARVLEPGDDPGTAFPRIARLSDVRMDVHNCPVSVEGNYAGTKGSVRVHGVEVGSVRLMAPDSPLFSDLSEAGSLALRAAVGTSFDVVRERCDVMLIEGAGSAVEGVIEEDVSNFEVCRLSTGPVVLSARWSRGGCIPALHGTLQLLPAAVRRRVRGYVITDVFDEQAVLRSIESRCPGLVPLWLGSIPHLAHLTATSSRDGEDHNIRQWLTAVADLIERPAFADVVGEVHARRG